MELKFLSLFLCSENFFKVPASSSMETKSVTNFDGETPDLIRDIVSFQSLFPFGESN